MRYQGGKSRLKKTIVPLLLQHNPQRIIEPFLGGGSIMVEAHKQGYTGEYIAGDYNPDLNEMWRAIIEDGWAPDDTMKPTREEYNAMRNAVNAKPTALRGMIRTGASFGSMPWSSYILDMKRPDGKPRNDWKELINGVNRDVQTIKQQKNIKITGGDYNLYESHITPESVIYCDPPYANTAGYGSDFDHETFWNTMRKWSKLCPVYISEYSAPDDFTIIHSKDLSKSLGSHHTKPGQKAKRVNDSLYIHSSRIR